MTTSPESRSRANRGTKAARPVTRLLKFGIGLVFYGLSEAWRMLLRFVGKYQPPTAVAIYYHHVLDEDREAIKRQLDHLVRWTTPLPAHSSQPLQPGLRYSIVTADDGWKSFADNAIPELQARNIPVALFAISDRLGQSINGIAFDRLITRAELQALKYEMLTVGSHTASHPSLPMLNEAQAFYELRQSHDKLTDILREDIKLFSFPYGAYNQRLISMCREAGYERVFTCMAEFAKPGAYLTGRVRVDPTDWPLEFHLKLMGAYRWVPAAISLKRLILSVIRGSVRVFKHSPQVPAS